MAVWSLGAAALFAAEPNTDFFEKRIRPVLVEHCYECHAADSEPLQGGLRLDVGNGLQTGGDSGPALDRDNPQESLLLKALRYDGVEMPPDGKLPAEVIADFETWIKAGAPDPREDAPVTERVMVDQEAAAKWWAFQRVQEVVPPDHPEAAAGFEETQVLDRFINVSLAEAGLTPAPSAQPATLLRRVYLDLLGLPPSPEEVLRFQQDRSPDALERLIDRLLASPAYGERWGRYWLDAARYADSNGADENHAFPFAWKYRDYVVRAMNQDLPYDQFIVEQLAGDLLPSESTEERYERWTATGFLIIGPKMLAEQDKPKMVADIVDEQIDTVGQAFMAMTFGCARCHDHKFDPIAARDYYALAGIFHSTKTMANLDFVSQWNERETPEAATSAEIETHNAHQQKIAEKKEEIERFLKEAGKEEGKLTAEERKPLKSLRKELEELEKKMPKLSAVMAADESEVKTVPIHIRGNHLQLGPEPIPRGIPTIFTSTTTAPVFPPDRSGRLELARWLASPEHPLTSRVFVNRLWQGHFGEGLVRSPGNFGLKGEEPTHPELLDWLARDFVAGEWSIKRMHRQILLSAAYRRASLQSPAQSQGDLENRFWSHQNRRRLEIEPLRDALLVLGDHWDRTIGGQAEAIYGKFETTGVERTQQDALRRTIYLPINRAALSELFSTFDYVDSAVSVPKRNSTVVPHQALFLMNNPMVIEQAYLFSKRVRAYPGSDADRVDFAMRAAFGRSAEVTEIEAALAFLRTNIHTPEATAAQESVAAAGQSDDSDSGAAVAGAASEAYERRVARTWHRLCLSLISANEFLTID